jgi:hypothetical protein
MVLRPIAPTLKRNLLAFAQAYATAREVSLATVSRYTTNDSQTLVRLRDDPTASITLRKYDDAMAWFVAHWPQGARRPKIVDPSHWRRRAA